MKKLEDFKAEKVEIKSIYGGRMMADATVTETKCSCGDHWHVDHSSPDK
jgi:hypothetical protein